MEKARAICKTYEWVGVMRRCRFLHITRLGPDVVASTLCCEEDDLLNLLIVEGAHGKPKWHCSSAPLYQFVCKVSSRSVSGLTGTASSRWSGSPVPVLAGEVVHRLEPTGSPVWTGYAGRNELPGSHCGLSFLASLTIVYCRIKELSTEQFWNSDTSTINLRVGPVNSYEHQ